MQKMLLFYSSYPWRRFSTLLLAFLLVLSSDLRANSQDKEWIGFSNTSLPQAFNEIGKVFHVKFFYSADVIRPGEKITLPRKERSLSSLLEEFGSETGLKFRQVGNTIGVQRIAQQPAPEDKSFTLSGKITDPQGHPLPGVTVRNRNTRNGTSTDPEGNYSIHVKYGDVLVFSYVGYDSREIAVAERNFEDRKNPTGVSLPEGSDRKMNVVMTQGSNKLAQMIVTGYTTKSAGEVTGSLQQISGTTIRNGITSSDATAMLQGKVTGLYITNQSEGDPTSSGNIVVRGPSSIASIGIDKYNEYVLPTTIYSPLIVLDGVIMPSQTSPGVATTIKDVVNPEDIASITILKDAASTAIYGSRAAAGVIVITTKKGSSDGLHVSLDLKYGYNSPDRGNIRFLSGTELYNYQKIYYQENWDQNSGYLINPGSGINNEQDYLNFVLPSLRQVQDSSFDYQKYGFLTSATKEVNLSASGGNEKTRYYIGAGYYNEQSTGIDNGLARKTFRINVDNTFNSHFSFNASLNGIFDDGLRDNSSFGGSIYQLVPWAWPYNPNGSPKPELDYTNGGYPTTAPNFLYDKQYNYNTIRNQQLFGSLKITYNINDWLSASSTNSFSLGYYKNEVYTDARTYYGYTFGANGGMSDSYSYYNSTLTSNILNFHKTWNDHTLSALVGQEFGTTVNETNGVNVAGIKPGYHQISLAQNIGSIYGYDLGQKQGNVNGDEFDQVMFSVFGELGYNYKNKYFLSSSARTDASTNFGPDKRYGTFYSVGASWLLSNEDFLKESNSISLLKLRANYGTSGSQNGNNFFTQTLYNPSLQYGGQSAATIASLGNLNIGWETTQTLSIGADFGFLHNRISGNVDYYRRNSIDLIQKVKLTAAIGFPAQYRNTGNVQNRGWEIMLNTENIKSKNFSWTTNFNISVNKNVLMKAYGDSLNTNSGYYLYPGNDINTIKAVKEVGVDPQTGNPLYQKLLFNAKGEVTGSQNVQSLDSVLSLNDPRQFQTLGSVQPKFYGGITNTFTYKNLSLSILLYYQYGNIMFNQYRFDFQMNSVNSYNQIAYINGQRLWTAAGQANATEPSLYSQVNSDWWNPLNSHFYDNGSFLRVRNIRLSYDLPKNVLNKLKIAGAQIYVSGDNLLTFTHNGFLGSDPAGETAADAYQQATGGVGFGLGTPRKYLVGLHLTF